MTGLAFLFLAAISPPSGDHMACVAGTRIAFAPGSDRIGPAAARRLESYRAASRRRGAGGEVRIDAGGDEALARRRAEAIRAWLAARGVAAGRMRVALRDELDAGERHAVLIAELVPPDTPGPHIVCP